MIALARAVVEVRGVEELMKHLADAQKLEKVKRVVKTHTARLNRKAVANAQFRGHWRGKKFINPTGATKRSIVPEIAGGGLIGKVRAGTHYSGYLEEGTRLMEAQPFMKPAAKAVEPQFVSDLKGVME